MREEAALTAGDGEAPPPGAGEGVDDDDEEFGCWAADADEAGTGWYLFGCWEDAAAAAAAAEAVMEGEVCCRRAVKKFVRKKERWDGIVGGAEPGIWGELRLGLRPGVWGGGGIGQSS